jgi:hypothetical protein
MRDPADKKPVQPPRALAIAITLARLRAAFIVLSPDPLPTAATACPLWSIRGIIGMPFSTRYNCLFIHVPRTGGTTVEKILGIYREWPTLDLNILRGRLAIGKEEYQLQHLSIQEAFQFLPSSAANCFAFAFVRNPWDRMVSEYFWQQYYWPDGGGSGDFELFIDRACAIVNAREELEGRNCHYRPQIEFLGDKISFVGRFENFEADLRKVLTALGFEKIEMRHEYKTPHQCYRQYYNDTSQKRVARAYESDIDAFKYNF